MNLTELHNALSLALQAMEPCLHGNHDTCGQTPASARYVDRLLTVARDAIEQAAAHVHAVDYGAASHRRFVKPRAAWSAAEVEAEKAAMGRLAEIATPGDEF